MRPSKRSDDTWSTFEKLLIHSLPMIRALVRRRRGTLRLGTEDTMDAVQDVYAKALSSRKSYSSMGTRAGWGWLKTITLRSLADRVRHWNSGKREVSRRTKTTADDTLPGTEKLPLEQLAQSEFRHNLADAIEDLPEVQRIVLSAQWNEGLSTAEIARRIGRSENAVRLLRSRGMEALRRSMKE